MTSVCWENLWNLPSCHGCTQVWIDPAVYCFRVRKSIWTPHLLFFENEYKNLFCHTFQIVEEMIKFFVDDFCVEVLYSIIEQFVSLFQVRNPLRNVDKNAILLSTCDLQHFPLCDPHPHLLFLIRSAFRVECFYVDVKRKILEILDNEVYTCGGDIRFWSAVLLSNMIIQITLVFCGEIETLGTIQCSNWTSLLVMYKIVSCSLDTTFITCNFFFLD